MAQIINLNNCSGCLLCQLACSFFYTPDRAFNLSKSAIRVRRAQKRSGFDVEILDHCKECDLCVNYCHYGVLTDSKEKKKEV